MRNLLNSEAVGFKPLQRKGLGVLVLGGNLSIWHEILPSTAPS